MNVLTPARAARRMLTVAVVAITVMVGVLGAEGMAGDHRGWRSAGPKAAARRLPAIRVLGVLTLVLGLSGALAGPVAASQLRQPPLPEPAGAPASPRVRHPVPPLRLWQPAFLGHRGWQPSTREPATALGSMWRVQPTPDPAGLLEDGLDAASCTGSTACTAVGRYVNRSGAVASLAEHWNGTHWSVQATPSPAGATGSQLFGVSCTTASACTAAGAYVDHAGHTLALAERWNGTSWRIRATPNPAGAAASALFGISCTSARSCTAAGEYINGAGTPVSLAEHWNGTGWRVQMVPAPSGALASGLFGVSCATASVCTAAGTYENSAGEIKTLAELWNGTRWHVQATPNPAGTPASTLEGVSCTSARACMAVGRYLTSGGTANMLAERWNGRSWSVQVTPSPAGAVASELRAVSCGAPGACTAVGAYFTNGGISSAPLAERWDGTRWRVQATASPAGSILPEFAAVSCSPAGACTAAGDYGTRLAADLTLVETWDGVSWRLRATPNRPGAQTSNLLALSCRAAAACTAVGYSINGVGFTNGVSRMLTLAERWDGTRWAIQATPNPPGAAAAELAGVSCTPPGACTAVGHEVAHGQDRPLAERWGGTRWAIQATPAPAGATRGSELSGVSCTSANACTAVGSYTTSTGRAAPFAEAWNGTRWTIQVTPNPAGSGRLSGVSCSTAIACVAAGDYGTEIWNGKSWRFQAMAKPTGSHAVHLPAVSCTSAAACTAVGSYNSSAGLPVTLAERWNGTHWAIQATPSAAGQPTRLDAVSCTSAAACTAAGAHFTGQAFIVPQGLAETWDGTRWTLQSTPAPAGGVSTLLNGVSCSTAAACTTAGYYIQLSQIQLTLAVARA